MFRIETQRVEKYLSGKQNIIAAIFDLKNNFGYRDKQDIDIKGDITTRTIRLPAKQEEGCSLDVDAHDDNGDT